MNRVFACIVIVFACISIAASQTTTDYDYARGVDFTAFHTFTWAKAYYAIQDPDANLAMAAAAQHELEARGVTYVPDNQKFDIFVTYNAIVNQDPADSSKKTLTLKVRIFDSRNNNMVWQCGGYINLGNDRQQNRLAARKLLAQIFAKYPPS